MLRSQSIQRDNIPRRDNLPKRLEKKSSNQPVQEKPVAQPAKNTGKPETKQTVTFFYGVNSGSNTLCNHLTQSAANTKGVHIDEFLNGSYRPQGDVAVWGILRGGEQVINWAQQNGRNFYYIDNPYIKFKDKARAVRITRNENQITHLKNVPYDRMSNLLPEIQPYRRSDPSKSILICPPSEGMICYWGLQNWLQNTINQLMGVTQRKIEIRNKPSPVHVYRKKNGLLDTWEEEIVNTATSEPLDKVLARTHAVVTFNSTVAFESLRQGIPVFCSSQCSASLLGNTDLSHIETPLLKDRRPLFATLAYSQWTMSELNSQIFWKYT